MVQIVHLGFEHGNIKYTVMQLYRYSPRTGSNV